MVIDPINAYLGVALDTHRDAALRAVLTPLALLAQRWGVIVLCIRHLTKGTRDKAIYRGQGNIAYTAQARVVFLVGVNPDDERERVMACIKNNLAPLPPALAFELVDGRFLWRGETAVTPAALLAPDRGDEDRSALAEAKDFLADLLADGPVEVKQVQAAARAAGLAWRTIERAKAALGVKAHREGFGPGGRSVWEMPSTPHSPPNSHTIETWRTMDASDTKPPQETDGLAEYGEAAPVPVCTHRPPGEVEDRCQHHDGGPDPHACACCGAPVHADQWQDDLCPVCRDGRPVKEGSGHLVRLALDMGAKEVTS